MNGGVAVEAEALYAIKERAKKATNGPWKVYSDDFSVRIGTEFEHTQLKAPSPIVIEAYHRGGKTGIYISPNNAAFIAHAREDVRLLLEMVEEMQVAMLDAEKQIHELKVFKHHAEFLLPYFLFEHIEHEAKRHLLLEQLDN